MEKTKTKSRIQPSAAAVGKDDAKLSSDCEWLELYEGSPEKLSGKCAVLS